MLFKIFLFILLSLSLPHPSSSSSSPSLSLSCPRTSLLTSTFSVETPNTHNSNSNSNSNSTSTSNSDALPKTDKSGRFCSPRAARELALSIVYASCLEGSDPVRLVEKRINARRGYEFDKETLLQYNHMSFGGPPVTAETVEEEEKLILIWFLVAPWWSRMAKVGDRTEDFKDTVRHTALSLGYDESKLAAILANFIIHKPRQRSPFTKAALKTLESIGTLEQFMVTHRKDYVGLHRTTEQERDSIEHEVSAFINACQEQIDVLKNSINDEEATSKGWLGIRVNKSNADTVAHKHGVVLNLSERLHSVTSQFDQLRAIRFQDAISRATPRRKFKPVAKSSSEDRSKSNNLDFREPDQFQPEPLKVQQQHLDDEHMLFRWS